MVYWTFPSSPTLREFTMNKNMSINIMFNKIQIIITHYEVVPPSFPHPVIYNVFPGPPPHPSERGLEMLVREGQHLSFGS